jgi:hypothetical protein
MTQLELKRRADAQLAYLRAVDTFRRHSLNSPVLGTLIEDKLVRVHRKRGVPTVQILKRGRQRLEEAKNKAELVRS